MAKGEGELLGPQPLRPADLLDMVDATTTTTTSTPPRALDAATTPSPIALPPLVTTQSQPSIALPPFPTLPALLPAPRREVLLAPAPGSPLPPLRFNSLLGKQSLRPGVAVPGPLNAILDASLQDAHHTPMTSQPAPAVDGLQQAAVQLALLAEFNRSAYSSGGCDIKREPALTIMKPKLVKPRRKRKPRVPDNLYCRSCGSTETPEWRRGPDGEKSLCNACGLHFAKILRREQMARPAVAEPVANKTSITFLLN